MRKLVGVVLILGSMVACSSTSKEAATVTVSEPVETTSAETEPATVPPTTEQAATTEAPTTEAPAATTQPATTTTELVCPDGQKVNYSGRSCVVVVSTTTPSPRAQPPAPVTAVALEEFAALLQAPAIAWMTAPSGPGFDAIAAGASALLADVRRPLPAFGLFGSPNDTRAILTALSGYPGNDALVYVALNSLRSALPLIPFMLTDGDYTVGAEVPPGTYRTIDSVDGCYWETLDNAGEINDNNFVNAAPQVIMVINRSDFAVNSDGCGPWVKIS